MNQQEFNNLKIGDKVVVADNLCMDALYACSGQIALSYCSQEGRVEKKYSIEYHLKPSSTVTVRFVNGSSYTFNIEDIYIMQDKQTKTQHKHAACIKAWADGEEIQVKVGHDQWDDLATCPNWKGIDYRIKPKFEKRYKYAYFSPSFGCWKVSDEYYSDSEWKRQCDTLTAVKIEASGKDFQYN